MEGRRPYARFLFVLTIFAGSFLLFLVQPMIARMALPRLGGTPAVWNSAMIVYQGLLLAGYAYAHGLSRLAPARQATVHLLLLLLAAATLPIGLAAGLPPADASPYVWVPWLLLVSIGPLFFVISAQAPLIQRWYSLTLGDDPYRLYAASNLGSFGGLLAYPLLAEPMLSIAQQRWMWSGGYVLVVLLVAMCAARLPRANVEAQPKTSGPPVPWRSLAAWALLAAIPSGLILSTTLYLTTDVVAMPLLWVVPLGAYLLSFSIAFAERRALANIIGRIAPFVLLISIGAMALDQFALFIASIVVLNFFTVSVALHSQLFKRRPAPQRLTIFYLAMSVGGLLGGVFSGLVAPLIFDWTYENLLLLMAAAFLLNTRSPFEHFVNLWDGSRAAHRATVATLVALAGLVAAGHGLLGLPEDKVALGAALAIIAVSIFAIGNRLLFAASVGGFIVTAVIWDRLVMSAEPGRMTRSYFGIYSIESGTGNATTLVHGTTLHGAQNQGSPQLERMPTTYYVPRSGVGLALAAASSLFGGRARIDVIGLGAGTLACYARPQQSWTFYEIDPVVADIAQNSRHFTFLARCQPDARIVIGDARISLERAEPAGADLIVVDAFSSDSIPMHLLTWEAFASYRRRLSDDGLLLIHISNRHVDLEPVVAGIAASGSWDARVRIFRPTSREVAQNSATSTWVALSPNPNMLKRLAEQGGEKWNALSNARRPIIWTDDYASLLPLVRWPT